MTRVQSALHHFDPQSRLASWPSRPQIQHLAVWAHWLRLARLISLTEHQMSQYLNHWDLFGAAAMLRRTVVELRLFFPQR